MPWTVVGTWVLPHVFPLGQVINLDVAHCKMRTLGEG